MTTFAARKVIGALHFITRRLWGFEPQLMDVVVDRLGPARAVAWFVADMPRYEATLKRFGPIRTHLVCTTISLLNGCPYCVHGHAYALELAYLAARDRLFPLDEHAITALTSEPPDTMVARFEHAVTDAGLEGELPLLRRTRALRDGAAAISADERRVAHLIAMFRVLNTCGIEGHVAPDEAHDPLNRNADLKRRYAALRSEERRRDTGSPARR